MNTGKTGGIDHETSTDRPALCLHRAVRPAGIIRLGGGYRGGTELIRPAETTTETGEGTGDRTEEERPPELAPSAVADAGDTAGAVLLSNGIADGPAVVDTFQALQDAVNTGAKNIKLTGTLTVSGTEVITVGETVPAGEITITATENSGPMFAVEAGGSLTIRGSAQSRIVLDGGAEESVKRDAPLIDCSDFELLSLEYVTVQNNYNTGGAETPTGGGICVRNGRKVTLTEVNLTGNTASEGNGGGIYIDHSIVAIDGAEILHNGEQEYERTKYGSGIFVQGNSSLTVTNSQINDNYTTDGGSGIYAVGSTVVLDDVEVLSNESWVGTAGFRAENVDIRLNDVDIASNHSTVSSDYHSVDWKNCKVVIDGNTKFAPADGYNPYGGSWISGDMDVTIARGFCGSVLVRHRDEHLNERDPFPFHFECPTLDQRRKVSFLDDDHEKFFWMDENGDSITELPTVENEDACPDPGENPGENPGGEGEGAGDGEGEGEDGGSGQTTPSRRDSDGGDYYGTEKWDEVKRQIRAADEGDTIKVSATGLPHFPSSVARELKGRDITLEIRKNGVTYKVNGLEIGAVDKVWYEFENIEEQLLTAGPEEDKADEQKPQDENTVKENPDTGR